MPGKAEYILGRIEKVFGGLSKSPERGAYPKELLAIGIREYREIFFKPNLIICRIMEKKRLCPPDRRQPPRYADAVAAAIAGGLNRPDVRPPDQALPPP